jgi:hypothetical protein
MTPRNITCSICERVYTGSNSWNTDSDDEIESGLFQAMANFVPKSSPEVEVPTDSQPSSPVRPPSTDSWEQEPFVYESVVGAHTPPLELRHETEVVARQETETRQISINAVASREKACLQQNLSHGTGQESPRHHYHPHEQRQSDHPKIGSQLSRTQL